MFERTLLGELRNVVLSGPPEGPALIELRLDRGVIRASGSAKPLLSTQDHAARQDNTSRTQAVCNQDTCGRGSRCLDTPDGPVCPDGNDIENCKHALHDGRFCIDNYKGTAVAEFRVGVRMGPLSSSLLPVQRQANMASRIGSHAGFVEADNGIKYIEQGILGDVMGKSRVYRISVTVESFGETEKNILVPCDRISCFAGSLISLCEAFYYYYC